MPRLYTKACQKATAPVVRWRMLVRLPPCPLCNGAMGFVVYHPDAVVHPPVKKKCKRCKNWLTGAAKINPRIGEPREEALPDAGVGVREMSDGSSCTTPATVSQGTDQPTP